MRRQLLAVAAALGLAALPAAAQPAKRPNFLVIVADDLGFSDLGAFGGEIETPHLDALARSGVRLTGFHTAPTCSPTRAMLLSGTDHHRAGLGTMAELVAPNQRGKPGHEGYLSTNVAALPELLAANGYRTLMSGKWHLGLAPEHDPSRRGFQQSFTLLQGAHNHFGEPLAPDGSAMGATYRQDGRTLTTLPDGFYSSDFFADKLVAQLKSRPADKPFFAYLAFTAPHWPLHAPAETIAKYKGRYDAGFEVLRAARLKRQAELGLVDPAKTAHPLTLKRGGWDKLTPTERATAARAMEVYAAMVDRMDAAIGRVVAHLKATGEFDNTVIVFHADNGAEGLDLNDTSLKQMAERMKGADNRLANMGAASSYIAYGPGWAQAATAPSRLYKAHQTEGGTRAVAFIRGPGVARPGGVAPAFGTVMDVTPTLLDYAGIADHQGRFAGRPVEPIRGKSWVPYLTGQAERVHAPDAAVGGELFGARALRRGDWKLLHTGEGEWKLFNLADDPGETRDLAGAEPARRAELVALWDAWAKEAGVILPDQVLYRP